MKKQLFQLSAISLVLMLCFTLGCQQQSDVIDVEADTAAIIELMNKFTEAVNDGDLEQWISLWTDDGVRMAPGAPATVGKENIREEVRDRFESFTVVETINTEEVKVAGDWGFARGTYTFIMTPKTGGDSIEGVGKYLSILQRQADGSWKFTRDCFNSNEPSEPE